MLEETEEMISACDTQEFSPFGRKYVAIHPGKTCFQVEGSDITDHGLPLVKALKDISISKEIKRDWWKLRESANGSSPEEGVLDEELYIHENTVVWSRGTSENGSQVIKSFTMDSAVQEALWCSFLLPVDEVLNPNECPPEIPPAVKQLGLCIVESNNVSVFTTEGRDYVTAIPFNIRKSWPILNGLLFERSAAEKALNNVSRTPKKGDKQSNLPVLFCMLHPLDDIAPVVCRTGGNSSSAKVSYVTETTQQIVFTCNEPSLVMTYDRLLSAHSVWTARRVRIEEIFAVMGGVESANVTSSQQYEMNNTPAVSKSTSAHLSRLSLSTQSPSLSPFRSYQSRNSSPTMIHSKLNSPVSHLGMLSRSQSPGMSNVSFQRMNTPSPTGASSLNASTFGTATGGVSKNSPGVYARSPLSRNQSMGDWTNSCLYPQEQVEPLAPEVCLDHLWTESGVSRDGLSGKTSNVFLTQDLCGQRYICYFITYRHHLRCVKYEESNDKSQLIFGSMSTISCLDACPLSKLNMMLVLDNSSNLILYSGLVKINSIYMAGIPAPLSTSVSHPQPPQNMVLRPASPLRFCTGPVTSSRPASAMDVRFDDEVQMLSPVPTEFNDSSQLLETSSQLMTDDLSFQQQPSTLISGMRDPVENRFTVELTDGSLYRASLPLMSTTPVIALCLEGLRQILPKDASLQVLTRWYSSHNAPGSVNGQSEWVQFCRCVLSLMGYDVDKLPLTKQVNIELSSPILAKKSRPSDQGCDRDWEDLLKSHHHDLFVSTQDHVAGLGQASLKEEVKTGNIPLDTGAVLFQHIPAILFALHLVYEELKLHSLVNESLSCLAELLYQLSCDLHCELYTDHYCRDWPELYSKSHQRSCINEEFLQQMHQPSLFTRIPPKIYEWLTCFLRGISDLQPFPYLPGVSERTKYVIAMFVVMFEEKDLNDITWSEHLHKISRAGHRSPDFETSLVKILQDIPKESSQFERLILFMCHMDFMKDSLVGALSLLLKEAVYQCRDCPPTNWPRQAYSLIGREDLARQRDTDEVVVIPERDVTASIMKGVKEEEDGMEYLDQQLLKLRFSEDLRVNEVRRLLQSSKPVRVAIVQRPEFSDHEFIEEQERHLYATCIRTMALPLGRGIFTLSTYYPVPTEVLPIPKLCLTGRAPPRNTTVDLTHIDTPANMSHWPQFHNGVAAGLRIANLTQLHSTWILYNKPKSVDLTNEHAGFLMGLGLNGHLCSLATLNVHDYLCRGHDMTSVGLILGISAGKRGSMDVATTKMLSIHVGALLPPTSTELDMPHNVQVAAVIGVGLVYQGTAHRHIAEVLLSEIGRPPGPEMENCADRESYSLAAGLALGMVMLSKGKEVSGLSDLSMADELYHYMVGGHKRPLTGSSKERYKSPSYQIKEGDSVNIDVTSPGATLALGMMFFNTGNSAVAEWLTAPDTQFLLDFVRPDFLMLRIISKGLVMWDYIHPSEQWINSNLPEIVSTYAFNKLKYQDDPDCDIDFETMSQAYCNIIGGACMAMALKFAGSTNQSAFDCLCDMARKIMKLMSKPLLVEQAGKSTVENCLVVIVLSLAMVMAGSGNLEVLRLCRRLRSRVGAVYTYVLYGSHLATSMAVGLLFMGGGRYTLSTKPEAIAAMLCAFFPKFPIHSNDNRYHLQALRHLYVLAAEPRVLLPKDVVSGLPCYVPLEVSFKATDNYPSHSFEVMAPCVLPELDLVQNVKVKGPRYWPISFELDKSCDTLKDILSGNGFLYVKQRAGHLSYATDPKGYHSVLSQSLTQDPPLGKVIKADDIESFSSDPRILAFAEYFCSSTHDQEFDMKQFSSKVLYECMSQEKLEVLSLYFSLQQLQDLAEVRPRSQQLQQVKLISAFYSRLNQVSTNSHSIQMISEEFLLHLESAVTNLLHNWLEKPGTRECILQYFSQQKIEATEHYGLLSTYLTWHEVPHPVQLLELGVTEHTPFPVLYQKLWKKGLTISSTMGLAHTLQMFATTNK